MQRVLQWLVVATTVFAFAQAQTAPHLTFRFDPKHAAGVSGRIDIQYASENSTRARISADLDFSRVERGIARAINNKCPEHVTTYEWHIHVKWFASRRSASLKECSLAAVGNHYDPSKACGPSSEFAWTDLCKSRVKHYKCTPARYRKHPWACEKGDLSGKLGDLELGRHDRVRAEWVDPFFPAVTEVSPDWNIVVHAKCTGENPRLACARVIER